MNPVPEPGPDPDPNPDPAADADWERQSDPDALGLRARLKCGNDVDVDIGVEVSVKGEVSFEERSAVTARSCVVGWMKEDGWRMRRRVSVDRSPPKVGELSDVTIGLNNCPVW